MSKILVISICGREVEAIESVDLKDMTLDQYVLARVQEELDKRAKFSEQYEGLDEPYGETVEEVGQAYIYLNEEENREIYEQEKYPEFCQALLNGEESDEPIQYVDELSSIKKDYNIPEMYEMYGDTEEE